MRVRVHDSFKKYFEKYDWFRCLSLSHMTAAGLGLEPRYLGPKPSVLPLDDPAMKYMAKCHGFRIHQNALHSNIWRAGENVAYYRQLNDGECHERTALPAPRPEDRRHLRPDERGARHAPAPDGGPCLQAGTRRGNVDQLDQSPSRRAGASTGMTGALVAARSRGDLFYLTFLFFFDASMNARKIGCGASGRA